VRGPRGTGLTPAQIIETFERRLENPRLRARRGLRNIHRIAELRLNDKFGVEPAARQPGVGLAERWRAFSDPGFAEKGQLTVTYLTDAHRAAARRSPLDARVRLRRGGSMRSATWSAATAARGTQTRKTLLTGSHYDTVRNGGKYDGRLGIFTPMACVRELRAPAAPAVRHRGGRLRRGGRPALQGDLPRLGRADRAVRSGLAGPEGRRRRHDARGDAHAGLPATLDAIAALQARPGRYLGFVEVHIEQGPVLNELDLPLGVVTSINGGVRFAVRGDRGMASHAGTTPMDRRRDAAAAVAELALFVEKRAARAGDSVGTIGMLEVPNGSTNVVPGRCQFTLDLRAPPTRSATPASTTCSPKLQAICERRGLRPRSRRRCAPPPRQRARWQQRWERAVAALGLPLHRMPSGAGHDAMKLHEVMPQAMLFVRGENAGISHNPLEAPPATTCSWRRGLPQLLDKPGRGKRGRA
jgi:N-carbamoyl-L-amino-acid hydrolase